MYENEGLLQQFRANKRMISKHIILCKLKHNE